MQMFVQRGLRELVENDSRFLSFPMVEPEVAWFPDAWTPDEAGVHRLIRRIMTHVGLGETPLSIDRAEHTSLRKIDAGVARFGLGPEEIGDPEALIAVLARAVACAYRAIHGLAVEDPEEADLTDLTTVFFGFGVFTVNHMQREMLSFALACWVRARGIEIDLTLLERWLESEPFETLERHLADLPSGVRARLGVVSTPMPKERPARKLSDAPPPLADGEPIDFSLKRGRTFRVRGLLERLLSGETCSECGAELRADLREGRQHRVDAERAQAHQRRDHRDELPKRDRRPLIGGMGWRDLRHAFAHAAKPCEGRPLTFADLPLWCIASLIHYGARPT